MDLIKKKEEETPVNTRNSQKVGSEKGGDGVPVDTG